jgi:hypothetical protein
MKANADKASSTDIEDNFVANYLSCLTSYFITVSYAGDRKFQQAFLLSARALRTYEDCMQLIEVKLGGSEHVKASRPALAEKVTYMTQLMDSLEKVKVRCHAKMLLQKAEQHRAI